jgi:hypothetical protein
LFLLLAGGTTLAFPRIREAQLPTVQELIVTAIHQKLPGRRGSRFSNKAIERKGAPHCSAGIQHSALAQSQSEEQSVRHGASTYHHAKSVLNKIRRVNSQS